MYFLLAKTVVASEKAH